MFHSPSLGLKGNPPYPPLTGGYEKATPAAGRGAFVFSCPPDKGGVGRVAPLTKVFRIDPMKERLRLSSFVTALARLLRMRVWVRPVSDCENHVFP